jgi:O-antigen/teichoic acid export membrane protein
VTPWLKQLGFASAQGSLRTRFQRGVAWNVTGAILNNGANFLTNIAIANLIGREVFGQYGMIQSTLTSFVGIAQAAAGITATKYLAEFRSSNKERAGRILGLCAATTFATGALATLLVLFSAPWLASTTLKASFLARPLQIASAAVFFTVVNGYQMGALAGLESYREWAFANGLQGPIQFAICSLLAWRWGLQGAVTGLLATSAMRWLILHVALKREANRQGILLRYSGLSQERAILFRFALPAALSSLTAAPAIWLGNTFLVRQAGGYSQLALFSAALNLKNVVMFLPLLVNNVGMSLLNNQRGENNHLRYRKVFRANIFLTASAASGGALFVGVFGKYLLRLYGKTFLEGQHILTLLLSVAVIEATAMAFFQVIYSEEKMWLSFLGIMLPRDIALILFAHMFVPLYGAFGLGLAYMVAWILCSTIILCFVFRIGLSRTNRAPLRAVSLAGVLEGDSEL